VLPLVVSVSWILFDAGIPYVGSIGTGLVA
jgi:hypothetical protein